MDARSAAHVLEQVAALLALHGEPAATSKPFTTAARRLAAATGDLAQLDASGLLRTFHADVQAVCRDLLDTGDAALLERLREDTPEGLLEMLRIPGLGPSRIHRIHAGLHVDSVQELEEAARDGRLAALPRFGARLAEQVLQGIASLRDQGSPVLYPHALAEAHRLLAHVRAHPEVERAELAGALRRTNDLVRELDIVAACRTSPARVAAAIARAPQVREITGGGGRALTLRYADGFRLNLLCVTTPEFAVALWRATGSEAHVAEVKARLAARGYHVAGDHVRDADGREVPVDGEPMLYRMAGLDYVPPELREGLGEVDAAARHALPDLVRLGDLHGVLHCHSHFSDGEATILDLATAARARGWSYLGISDHSQSAFYAGGLDRESIIRQHAEIDAVNAQFADFRVLKGVEADILPCGRVDYDEATLDGFDYVIASVHSRFGMNERQMTDRVLKAMDDPHVTIIGHPTGRLLLTREPFAIDIDAVLEKAGAEGVAMELNADPHRLDLDWRVLRAAKRHGARIEIGPDAHAVAGLDNAELGVSMARKGWLAASDVLNALPLAQFREVVARRKAQPRRPTPAATPAVASGR
jgi:DNA polymerase (family 10)